MLAPVRTEAPAVDPVSWEDADSHLRLDGDTSEQTLVEAYIAAATAQLDGWTGILGRALITQTWRQDFDGFAHCMRLPLAPVQSISEITYYDSDNASQTLATSVYQLFTDMRSPLIGLKPDQTWPGTYTRPDAVSVTFVAGYGDAADVPRPIRQAILLTIGTWFENRESVVVGVSATDLPGNSAARNLVAPYRRIGV